MILLSPGIEIEQHAAPDNTLRCPCWNLWSVSIDRLFSKNMATMDAIHICRSLLMDIVQSHAIVELLLLLIGEVPEPIP